jgi:hypothetical protein
MPVARSNPIHQRAAGGLVSGVERKKFQMSVWTHGVTQAVGFVFLYVRGDHGCTFVQESQSYSAAKAAGAAGDESNF